MEKTKTYFEQVPLEIVKAIVGEPIAEAPARVERPRKRRRTRDGFGGRERWRARGLGISKVEESGHEQQ
jgi:hypothetical protein